MTQCAVHRARFTNKPDLSVIYNCGEGDAREDWIQWINGTDHLLDLGDGATGHPAGTCYSFVRNNGVDVWKIENNGASSLFRHLVMGKGGMHESWGDATHVIGDVPP